MNANIAQLFFFTLVPVAAMILGGIGASLRKPSEWFRSFVQHFAAGVVFAAMAGELLPAITKEHDNLAVVIGFALGVLVMLAVRQMAEGFERRAKTGGDNSFGMLAAVAIDLLIDGLLIGVGFAAGEQVGTLLVIALTLEMLFLGVSLTSSLSADGTPTPRILIILLLLGVIVLIAAVLGGTLLHGLSGMPLTIVLSFGAAALMYLVTEELLMEAHEVKETPLITTAFFAGFLALYLLELSTG